MFLRRLTIKNFRKLKAVDLVFDSGLNIIVGPNNVGKTAIVDALRSLLSSPEEPAPKFYEEDIYRSKGGVATGAIEFHYVFGGLSLDDEADFLSALVPDDTGVLHAHVHARYSDPDKSTGRLRSKRWCGLHEENGLTTEMVEDIRGVYLPPLRDAALGLRPNRTSQLARLIHILADEDGRQSIDTALKELDIALKTHRPLVDVQAAISGRHNDMVGAQLAQALQVDLSGSDFKRFSARLSLMVDAFEIEQNGLGFNNLIFMAVVLSELAKNQDSAYRGLIVEEPEAHLHPQLQAVLLRYLENVETIKNNLEATGADNPVVDTSAAMSPTPGAADVEESGGTVTELPVQVFVTSHSPNFASIAKLSSLVCLVETNDGASSFLPRSVPFGKGKREKLERYLDVTRAEIFFAKRIIFVEGAAELMLLNVLADRCGHNLRSHGVSLISVEGLNFDCFMPLFGNDRIRIPVAIITDADPSADVDGKIESLYPNLGDTIEVSANTAAMLAHQDDFVKVFHGLKTLEYDLALHQSNRSLMLKALTTLHPKLGADLETAVSNATGHQSKAEALFRGMFERRSGNVSKGRFGQALAQELLEDKVNCYVPEYIRLAIQHVCGGCESTS